MEPKFYIIAKKGSVAEIILYGYIGSWSDISSKRFIVEFRKLEKEYKQINIRINSGGGEVADGTAIYTTITNSQSTIHTYIDGMAASMGSILALAGDKVFMAKHAKLMMHKPTGGAYGSADKLRQTAESIDEWEDSLRDIYAQKTGLTTDEVKEKWMQPNVDKWLGAEAALKEKLIDEIFDGKVKKAPANSLQNPEDLYNYYSNQIQNSNTNFNQNTEMDTKVIALKIGLPENATEAQINAKIEELSNTNSILKNELEELKKKENDREKEQIKNILDAAIKDGKILEAKRKGWEKMLNDSFESSSKIIAEMGLPVKPADVIDEETGGEKTKMTYSEMLEKDRKGLEAMRKDKPEDFRELYKAEYGTYPQDE